MSRKVIFTLAAAATIAAAGLASSAADARGFGGGGGGHFGGGGFSRGGGFGGGHFGGGRIGGGRSFARLTPIRGGNPGFPGHGHPGFPGHNQWAHFHHHGHWFFRDGRWIVLDGVDGGYDEPGDVAQPVVSAPGPCTCLTKTYTQDGLVVFADVCTKEAASARVDGADVTPVPPVDKSSAVTPPAAATSTPPNAAADGNVNVAQAPTSTNYAGKTFQDFLAATAQAQKN
jgi:hypothetical protein